MLLGNCLATVLLGGITMSCSQSDDSTAASLPSIESSGGPAHSLTSTIDILRFHARPAFGIIQVEQRHDTLLLVSESSAVSYPLGKLSTPQAFLARYPGFALTFRDEDPDSTGVVRIYTATKGTNFVRLFKPEPADRWLEIASGDLIDPSLRLATGVHVGMSQQIFLNTFFTAPLALPTRPINTLALIYAVDGEMQYCHVSQGAIDRIQLASVFTIQ